ncbi:MAG: DUF393 domain-containing protein [Bacteroidales bacterium]|nr:DUF393 domain-containing protein [Bacteroidales bacterium]
MIEIRNERPFPAEIYEELISMIPIGKSLIVFDGTCVLCNGLIKFLIRIDSNRNLLFTTFNSSLFELEENKPSIPQSLILINHKGIFSGSEAVLETGISVQRFIILFRIFSLVPGKIRDTLYRIVATHRYKVFGRTDQCFIPSIEDAVRFLK